MAKRRIGIGIIGGSGYGAGELLRLLAVHPECEVVTIASRSHAGTPISELHPNLFRIYDLTCEAELNLAALQQYEEHVVFSALPHGVSSGTIAELLKEAPQNLRVVDLSGDFRLSDAALHSQFYPESEFQETLRRRFAYGLPELNRESIAKASCIANPGCYATACILSAAPLVNWMKAEVFFDAKSGTSGAGRSPSAGTHHPAVHADVSAYKVLAHRHEPEIQQVLGPDLPCSFVPQLLPVARGIYVTAHLRFGEPVSQALLADRYASLYGKTTFIRMRTSPPHLDHVLFSNFCDIYVAARGNRAVVCAALDNLVKGMAGQAIQNLNLMCGLPEETALLFPSPGLA